MDQPSSYTDAEREHALKVKCDAPGGIQCVTIVWEFGEPFVEDRPFGPHHKRIKKALKFATERHL